MLEISQAEQQKLSQLTTTSIKRKERFVLSFFVVLLNLKIVNFKLFLLFAMFFLVFI